MLNALHDLFSQFGKVVALLGDAFPADGMDPIIYVLLFVALILSLSIHEFGHAWMADKLGDPGPRKDGRVTLSPLAHLDPMGLLLIIASTLIGYPIGWGKPVKTDPDFYKVDRRTGIGLVALAGPGMNMLAAVTLAIPARILLYVLSEIRLDDWLVLVLGISFLLMIMTMLVSLSLFVFNLLPLYPLDGSHVLASLLPQDIAVVYARFMKRYGNYIFLVLLGTGVLGDIVGPVVIGLFRLLLGV